MTCAVAMLAVALLAAAAFVANLIWLRRFSLNLQKTTNERSARVSTPRR